MPESRKQQRIASIGRAARRTRDGFVHAADVVAERALEGLVFTALSVWGVFRRMLRAIERTSAGKTLSEVVRSRLRRAGDSPASHSMRRSLRSGIGRMRTNPVYGAVTTRIQYAIRWLDLRHRRYVLRGRRYVRHYLAVLIDPDVPVSRRAAHAARGAGAIGGVGAVLLMAYMIVLIPLTPDRDRIRQTGYAHP